MLRPKCHVEGDISQPEFSNRFKAVKIAGQVKKFRYSLPMEKTVVG